MRTMFQTELWFLSIDFMCSLVIVDTPTLIGKNLLKLTIYLAETQLNY